MQLSRTLFSVLKYASISLFLSVNSNFCNGQASNQQDKHTISGFVREQGSLETLIGVNIYFPALKTGTITNQYGFYSITLPTDSFELVYSFVGYLPQALKLFLNKDIELDIELERNLSLEAVEVRAERIEKVSENIRMSTIDIPVIEIKNIPTLFGEKDVLKVIQLLPGVQRGVEGSSGFYVRGGGPDQNLIILDDAIVYNVSHLFGFFSLFNGDAIKSLELTKGGMPARYGGRLSSVLDINMKDGNKQKHTGEAGIGLISSRLTLEGPILKNKASYLVSGRRTYLDLLVQPFFNNDVRAGYFFYDLNAKVNYEINRNNKLYLSGYFGRDKFYFNNKEDSYLSKIGLFWQNATGTLRWNHIFNNKLFSNTSLIYSNYKFQIYINQKFDDTRYDLKYYSGIEDIALKSDFSWHPGSSHIFRFGVSAIHHSFTPSAVVLQNTYDNEFRLEVKEINNIESGIYVEDEIKLGKRLKLLPGIRLSLFTGKDFNYFKPEPRFSASYSIMDNLALKASYARMNQYVHLLSNTGLGLPTDLWVPSVTNVPPQESWQLAAGIAKDFINPDLVITVEVYYKEGNNILGYKEGASFIMFDDPSGANRFDWTTNVTSGFGKAYGAEFFIQKKSGSFTGWIGYTLSWVIHQFDDVNNGIAFYGKYDRRHDISIVLNYRITPKLHLSGVWVYSTGNPITIPLSSSFSYYHNEGIDPNQSQGNNYQYEYPQYTYDYEGKNSFRAAAYHRLDFGAQFIDQVTLFNKKVERVIDLSIYNAYNRKNPFFYFWEQEYNEADGSSKYVLNQMSLFPIIPSLSLSYRF